MTAIGYSLQGSLDDIGELIEGVSIAVLGVPVIESRERVVRVFCFVAKPKGIELKETKGMVVVLRQVTGYHSGYLSWKRWEQP